MLGAPEEDVAVSGALANAPSVRAVVEAYPVVRLGAAGKGVEARGGLPVASVEIADAGVGIDDGRSIVATGPPEDSGLRPESGFVPELQLPAAGPKGEMDGAAGWATGAGPVRDGAAVGLEVERGALDAAAPRTFAEMPGAPVATPLSNSSRGSRRCAWISLSRPSSRWKRCSWR
jgi:hypothetical protein